MNSFEVGYFTLLKITYFNSLNRVVSICRFHEFNTFFPAKHFLIMISDYGHALSLYFILSNYYIVPNTLDELDTLFFFSKSIQEGMVST